MATAVDRSEGKSCEGGAALVNRWHRPEPAESRRDTAVLRGASWSHGSVAAALRRWRRHEPGGDIIAAGQRRSLHTRGFVLQFQLCNKHTPEDSRQSARTPLKQSVWARANQIDNIHVFQKLNHASPSVGKHATQERKEQHQHCNLEHDDCS